MSCRICVHEQRADIEQELLCRSMGDLSVTIDSVALKYNVKPVELQIHTLMHQVMPSEIGGTETPGTLVEAIKFKEAEYLRQTISEYQNTLSFLGVKIRETIKMHTDDNPTLQKLSRPSVDLYLGLGAEIRTSVDALVHMNNLVNGEHTDVLAGLTGLVNAIQSSGKPKDDTV